MPTNRLTDKACRAASPSSTSAKKLFDGHGMYLLVRSNGSKVWQMAFRWAGKTQTATFGPYPEVSLVVAREKRTALRAKLRDGIDPRPSATRPIDVPPAKSQMTLRQAMLSYWQGRGDASAGYRANAQRAFELHLGGILDNPPMAAIDRPTLMAELRKVDAAGKFVYVRRIRMWSSLVWEWAMEHPDETGVTFNPAQQINPRKAFGKARVESHAALALADVPAFWERLSYEDQSLHSVRACRLLALTWVRTQELRLMEWSELEQEGTLWRIPAGKMKRRHEHLVPLSTQAQGIVAELKAVDLGSRYVFPCDSGRRLDRPLSENAVLYLIGRMGFKGRMTGHGWRSVASTWANESGRYSPDAIERQLAHVPDDKVRAVYNRASYLEQRRQMLQDWADWLDAIRSERKDA